MGPILIQVLVDVCGFCLDMSNPIPPPGNENGVFNEELTWQYEQVIDVVFPRAPLTANFKLDDILSSPAISMYPNVGGV